MQPHERRAISEFRQTLAAVYLLRSGLAALTVWAFVYGVAVLALRGATGVSRIDLIWGLASLPLVLGPAAWFALRRLPTRDRVRAVLDQHARCGGLLMAGAEHELGRWSDEVPMVRGPRVEWRGGWRWGAFAAACAFVALGFLVPQSIASLGSSRLDVTREVDRLKEQIEVLQKEKVIDAEKAEALKVELDKLKREASGKDPVKTIEALDHVQDQLKKAAEEAAEKAHKKTEEASRLEALTDALRGKGDKLNKDEMKEALRKLAELMRKAMDENDLIEENLDAETLKAIQENKLTPEMLKKLAEALKEGKNGEMMKVAKLVKAKLVDAEQMKKSDKADKTDVAELAAYLKENGFGDDAKDKLSGQDGEDGKGGTDEGGGKSKLTFGDESNEDGVKFKEEELPPGEQQNLKDSQLSGISQGAPNIGKEKPKAGGSGALDGAKMGGGSAATQTVLPRHKGAVGRYFDRQMDKTKKN